MRSRNLDDPKIISTQVLLSIFILNLQQSHPIEKYHFILLWSISPRFLDRKRESLSIGTLFYVFPLFLIDYDFIYI